VEDVPRETRWHEIVAVVVLSITAVLTAWSGFEASKWSGAMSIAFSQASAQRIEAARADGDANAARGYDLNVFGVYVQAVAAGDERQATFVRDRFSPQLATAFAAWQATDPLTNPDAPKSPFAMDAYVVPGKAEAEAAGKRADALFDKALANNQRGDNYTLLTVLFALALFFTAVAGRMRTAQLRWTVQVLAIVVLTVGIVLLATFPVLV